MNRELFNEVMEVTTEAHKIWAGNVLSAIVEAYATIRAAEIVAAGKPEKEDSSRDAY